MNTSLLESDILFSPNRWCKRFAHNVVFDKHVDFITKHSEEVRKSISCELNIPYGSAQREVIDIYGIDLPSDSPLFLFIHGGYWHEEAITHQNNAFVAKRLYENGIKTILIGYELCPNLSLPDIVTRLGTATQKCLEYARHSKSRSIHVCGHSAGAHLVTLLFQTFVPSLSMEDQTLFKSSFLLCGLYDLLPLLETQVNQILDLDEETAKAMSPILCKNFSKSNTRFFVIVVQNDSPVFKKQGIQFKDYLAGSGLSSDYVFVENVDHYEVLEKLLDIEFEITQLIINTVKS